MKRVASSWLASSHPMSSHDECFISLLIISLLRYVGASVTAWNSCMVLSKQGVEEPPDGVQAWLSRWARMSCSITE